jgi:hypothetical protein
MLNDLFLGAPPTPTRLREGGHRIVWWEVEGPRRVAEILARFPAGFSADGRVLFAIDPVGPFFEEWTVGAEAPLRKAKAAPGGDLSMPTGWSLDKLLSDLEEQPARRLRESLSPRS